MPSLSTAFRFGLLGASRAAGDLIERLSSFSCRTPLLWSYCSSRFYDINFRLLTADTVTLFCLVCRCSIPAVVTATSGLSVLRDGAILIYSIGVSKLFVLSVESGDC